MQAQPHFCWYCAVAFAVQAEAEPEIMLDLLLGFDHMFLVEDSLVRIQRYQA